MKLAGTIVPSAHQGVNGLRREAEHPEAADVGDDVNVAHLAVFHALGTGAVGDQSAEYLRQRLEVVGSDVFRRSDFNADDDVGAHIAEHVGREVVHQTAVDQHFVANLDGGEQARNGHAGTHRVRHASVAEHYFIAGDHVGGHAGKGNGQVVEVHLLLIAYA